MAPAAVCCRGHAFVLPDRAGSILRRMRPASRWCAGCAGVAGRWGAFGAGRRASIGRWSGPGRSSPPRKPSTARAQPCRQPPRAAGPRRAGWAFEGITRDNRQRPTPAQASLTEAQLVFATWGGSWGRYSADAGSKQLTLRPEGSFSPNVMGRESIRSYAITGDRLTMTSRPGEPHARGATRWTWEKVPPVENLSPGYRQVMGFWRHEIESRVNLTLKTEVSTQARAERHRLHAVGLRRRPLPGAQPQSRSPPMPGRLTPRPRRRCAATWATSAPSASILARCSTRSWAARCRRAPR